MPSCASCMDNKKDIHSFILHSTNIYWVLEGQSGTGPVISPDTPSPTGRLAAGWSGLYFSDLRS